MAQTVEKHLGRHCQHLGKKALTKILFLLFCPSLLTSYSTDALDSVIMRSRTVQLIEKLWCRMLMMIWAVITAPGGMDIFQ
jgi:hypothetical protein